MAKKPSAWRPKRLVAVHKITGGTKDARHSTPSGTVLDREEIEKLGLNDADLLKLLSRGAIVEREERAGDRAAAEGELVPFDGLASIEIRAILDGHGVEYPEGASAEQLLEAAIAHGGAEEPEDIDAAANRIERDMKVDEIRDELGKLDVPFETDANKPALARLLAQVRAAGPAAPAEGAQDSEQLV